MKISGIYAPLVTPFSTDESINLDVMESLIEFLIKNKVDGLIPGGTTGEVYALSDDERREIFRFVHAKAKGRIKLMAGVNAGATRDVIAFATEAEKMGFDGLMVAVPPYSRPNQEELLAHFISVSKAVSLPIVLYNFPWRAGSEIGTTVMDGLVDQKNIVGIKEASGDINRIYEFKLRYGDRFSMICGSDAQALDFFLWGADSWIGGAVSCLPSEHVKVLEAAKTGDFLKAKSKMEKILPVLFNMESGYYTQKIKLGCELRGIKVGKPRQPLLPLPDEERASFISLFEQTIQEFQH